MVDSAACSWVYLSADIGLFACKAEGAVQGNMQGADKCQTWDSGLGPGSLCLGVLLGSSHIARSLKGSKQCCQLHPGLGGEVGPSSELLLDQPM